MLAMENDNINVVRAITSFAFQSPPSAPVDLPETNYCVINRLAGSVLISFQEGKMSDNVAIALIVAITIIIVFFIVRNRWKDVRTKYRGFEAELTAYRTSHKPPQSKDEVGETSNNDSENSQTVQVGIKNKITAYFHKIHIFQFGIGNELNSRNPKKRK
jgi:HAMP domain-containing protein